jgi:hypothetical protein
LMNADTSQINGVIHCKTWFPDQSNQPLLVRVGSALDGRITVLSCMVHFIILNSLPRFSALNSTHRDQPDSEHLKAMDTLFSTGSPDLIIDKGFVQDELAKSSERTEHRARLEAVRFGFSVRPEFKKDYSRILSLPREIRNAIYHELWKLGSVRALSFNGHPARLYYGAIDADHPRCVKGMPTWLLTNKAFLAEGMEQFHLKATWLFEPTPPRFEASHYVRLFPNVPPKILPSGRVIRQDTKVIDLSTARELTLRTHRPSIDWLKVFHIPADDRTYVYSILTRLESSSIKLKTLRFSTEFCYQQLLENPMDWRLQLGCLNKFQLQLDKFEYEVKGLEHLCKPHCENVAAWRLVQGAFAEAVKRVGKVWVGENGKLEVKVVKKRELHIGVWRSTLDWKYTYAKTKA